jgi:hypothetical protein
VLFRSGAVSGLLAGIIWCRVMMRPMMLEGRRRLGRLGAAVGIGVGVLSAILLHLGLMTYVGVILDTWQADALILGLVFAIPSGATLGAICGYVLRCKVDAGRVDAASALMRSDAPSDSPGTPA